MPARAELLAQLSMLAHDLLPLAVAWHVALLAAAVAVLVRGVPTTRLAGVVVALPLVSASAAAFAAGNAFNAPVLGAFAVLLIVLALREAGARLVAAPPWSRAAGAALLALGWFYPHFLPDMPWLYVIGAPVGVVPCATLCVATGAVLLAEGWPRGYGAALGWAGLFYGAIGTFRLGVVIDLALFAGALTLLARDVRAHRFAT